MNDIEYLYRQDIREKKATGRGVFSKKSGARTKYVGLTQDRLTSAQLKRRNSPVFTYNITTCIHSWSEFKSMPSDLQCEYLKRVIKTYNPSIEMIASAMGVTSESLRSLIHAKNFDIPLKRGGRKRQHPYWNAFLCDNRTTLGEAVKLSDAIVEPQEEPKEEPYEEVCSDVSEEMPVVEKCFVEDSIPDRLDAPSVYKFSVSMEGTAMQLYTMLSMLTDSKERYEFDLLVKSKGGDS